MEMKVYKLLFSRKTTILKYKTSGFLKLFVISLKISENIEK